MIIKGSLRSLKRDGVAGEVREAAADIDHEVARLDRIVGDVLDFARPLRLERAPVDVRALAQDAARATLEGAAGVSARMALEPSAGTIVTDGERLRGVLVNLISNARESLAAAPSSSGSEIEVGARGLDQGGVVLWVADRGPGIPPADLPHVFEPYFTTKRTGTGLGLAISRKVVEALGGTLRIESREGEGTRAEIELPAEAPAPTEVR